MSSDYKIISSDSHADPDRCEVVDGEFPPIGELTVDELPRADAEFEQPERQLVDEFAHLLIGKRDRLAAAREITDQPHRIRAICDETKEVIKERGFATDPRREFRFLDYIDCLHIKIQIAPYAMRLLIDRSEEHTTELQSLMSK